MKRSISAAWSTSSSRWKCEDITVTAAMRTGEYCCARARTPTKVSLSRGLGVSKWRPWRVRWVISTRQPPGGM
ncbi:MAG: hypothetical protein GY926_14995 [bacterium]|nr:hypothetical protein [bacterium]